MRGRASIHAETGMFILNEYRKIYIRTSSSTSLVLSPASPIVSSQWWRARLTACEQPSFVFATAKVGLFLTTALSACISGCLMLAIIEPVSASPTATRLVDVLWFTTFFLSSVFALSVSAATWFRSAAHHAGWTPVEFWQCCVFPCLPLVWGAWYALAWWTLLLIVGCVPPALLLLIVYGQRLDGLRAAFACVTTAYNSVLRTPFSVVLSASFLLCPAAALIGAVYAHVAARASFATFARDALGMFRPDAHGDVLIHALLVASVLVLFMCVLAIAAELVWRRELVRVASIVALQIDLFLLGLVVDKQLAASSALAAVNVAEAASTSASDAVLADLTADRRRLAMRYQEMQRQLKSCIHECADTFF